MLPTAKSTFDGGTPAQQAKPKVIGHSEPSRAQLMSASTLETTYSAAGDPWTGEEVDTPRAASNAKLCLLEVRPARSFNPCAKGALALTSCRLILAQRMNRLPRKAHQLNLM